ncbi:MAG: heme ABC exporter ATP-binding protein CcmA [Pseudolabrys sp.]
MELQAENLSCVRGGREVFGGLSFSVASGEALIVTGHNGAGKSSLLRAIAGLVRLAAGRLGLHGGDGELTIGEQSHYLGHLDAIKPGLSVTENLRFWTAYLGGGNEAAALDAVDLSALAALPAAYLSAGQRRRLALARLVAAQRPLWLLDEPTTALDAQAQTRLVTLMRGHLAGGGIIVAATHGDIGLAGARELRLGSA